MQRIGVVAVPVTIFKDTMEIDWERSKAHVEWLVQGGARMTLCGGTVAEVHSLEETERQELAARNVEWVAGRIPVYVCVAHTSTAGAIRLARQAQSAGATGIFSVPPFYGGMTEQEVLAFFREVAAAVDIPLMVYNNPWATPVRLSLPALVQLAEEGTASLIKDSQGDPGPCHNLRLLAPESLQVIYGEDTSAFEAIMAGADGWVTGVGNFMPRHCAKLWDLCTSGDVAAARDFWYRILPAINMTSIKPAFGRADERPDFWQVYKAALDILGLHGGPCRRPLAPLPPKDVEYLTQLIKDLDLTPETA